MRTRMMADRKQETRVSLWSPWCLAETAKLLVSGKRSSRLLSLDGHADLEAGTLLATVTGACTLHTSQAFQKR